MILFRELRPLRSGFAFQRRLLSSKTIARQTPLPVGSASAEKFSAPKAELSTSESPPLSLLPLISVLRSLAINSMTSSKILLPPSLAIMSALAHTKLRILSPEYNPLLRLALKKTFYAQFCAGENSLEVTRTVELLRNFGYSGVMMGYAKEIVMNEKESQSLAESSGTDTKERLKACMENEILPWAQGSLDTIDMTTSGDFVSLKFSGAGSLALYALSKNLPPPPALRDAIDSICDRATQRGIRLLFDAEQQAVQAGIDTWTIEYMSKYNKNSSGRAMIYGTYQAYLKATPRILASHMQIAKENGFTLGAKLVRGAYIGSDPRHLIHDTKADTDAAYNGIAESLARHEYGTFLKAAGPDSAMPEVDVVLAGHNIESVRKIQSLRQMQKERGEKQIELVYAQLQGMADEVSLELVLAGLKAKDKAALDAGAQAERIDVPCVYKYIVWGTTGECMKYLLRRAHENCDAIERTRESRNAMWRELVRRLKSGIGLA